MFFNLRARNKNCEKKIRENCMRYERNRSSVTTGKQVSKNWKWNTHCVILHSVVVSKVKLCMMGTMGTLFLDLSESLYMCMWNTILIALHCSIALSVLKMPMRDHCKCYTIFYFHFCRCVSDFTIPFSNLLTHKSVESIFIVIMVSVQKVHCISILSF